MFASVAFLPAIRSAGSPPGMTMKIRNTMKLTTTSTSTAPSSRADDERDHERHQCSILHLRARVERVAQAVAEDVERDDRQHDRRARDDRQPRRRPDALLALGDQRAPRRVRRLHAGAEERQRRLDQDVVGDDQREEDEHRRRDVREQLAEHDPERRSAPCEIDASMNSFSRSERICPRSGRPTYGDEDHGDDHRRDPETPGLDVDRPMVEAADRERGAERDPEQDHRQRRDQVEERA